MKLAHVIASKKSVLIHSYGIVNSVTAHVVTLRNVLVHSNGIINFAIALVQINATKDGFKILILANVIVSSKNALCLIYGMKSTAIAHAWSEIVNLDIYSIMIFANVFVIQVKNPIVFQTGVSMKELVNVNA